MGSTSERRDGVDSYQADVWDIDSYRQAEETIAQMRIPQLLRRSNPHDRLFVAGLDGTGNSMFKDAPENWSVVAKIYEQVNKLPEDVRERVAAGYVQGTFTQDNPLVRYSDGAFGHSFEERVETAYWQLCQQAKKWIEEDPQAQIRIVGVGFSRGAEEVAALTRLVHERGIMDPDKAEVTYNGKEQIVTRAVYHGPPLVPPGVTLQAVLLFDPVSTGVTEHDRRLASVVSSLQLTAQDERRDQFKADLLVPPGLSEDRRHANVTVGGAHSDVGDTYGLNGLGVLSYNAGISYFNRFSDVPLLDRRKGPADPSLYQVHRSDQGSFLWTSRSFGDGVRDARDDLSPPSACQPQQAIECRRMEPTHPALREQADGLTPPASESRRGASLHEFSERMDRMLAAAYRNDWDGFSRDTQALAFGESGRALMERANARVDQWDDQQRLVEMNAQQQAQQQPSHQSRGFSR